MKTAWQRLWGCSKRSKTTLLSLTSLLVAFFMLSLVSYQLARADAGGNPTSTPRPTATPTITLTPTATLIPTFTATLPPDENISAYPPVLQPVESPKAIPTDAPLSSTEILGTLEAESTQPEENRSLLWLYIFILLTVSAAVVIFVVIGLMRQKKATPPEE